MTKIKTYGEITGGVLKIIDRKRFFEALATLPDSIVSVTIDKAYETRSGQQNAYYWGVVVNECASGYYDLTGEWMNPQEAHELLKHKCNGKEVANKDTGEVLTVGQSTTEMTTVEMNEYWDRCRAFIKEWFGRAVPQPNETREEL